MAGKGADITKTEEVVEYLQSKSSALFAFLFGSVAKNRDRISSDLDLAVYFANPPQGLEILDMHHRLSELAGKEVDLVILNSASPFLRHHILKTGTKLFVKDLLVYRSFREKTITDYDEYKYVSGMDVYDRQAAH